LLNARGDFDKMQEHPNSSKSYHYRPGTPGRGEDTSRRILETAIQVFADEGYEGASTRMLAERAGVNLPAIQYYFGSKEGLYRAAIGHIADVVEDRMAICSHHVRAALAAGKLAEKELFGLLFEMLDSFLELITSPETPPSAGLLIARAEIENAAALEVLQQRVIDIVFRPCMALVARLLDRPEDDEEIKIRTMAIFGQALVFKNHGRTCACPVLGWNSISAPRLQTLQKLLREQTAAILHAAKDKAA
jgi:TetR/AcrR family transcriptional regulator, regulator of cefoperazone and chloramphenicol sensitivity